MRVPGRISSIENSCSRVPAGVRTVDLRRVVRPSDSSVVVTSQVSVERETSRPPKNIHWNGSRVPKRRRTITSAPIWRAISIEASWSACRSQGSMSG